MGKQSKPDKHASVQRSIGPKTAKGKQRSSMNAVKHGATSPRLLNAKEVASYILFLEDLKKYYKSSNPLVQMQLERISRLKIQLERVQEQMDSLHRLAALKSDHFDRAANAMGLDDDQIELASRIVVEITTSSIPDQKNFPFPRAELRLMLELEEFTDGYCSRLRSHQDLLELVPVFCKHIVSQANDREMGLWAYLEMHRPPPASAANDPRSKMSAVAKRLEKHLLGPQQEWREAQITDVPVEALKTAMNWFYQEALTSVQNFMKATRIRSVMNEVEGLFMPEAADVERLMRYQTTLQRQLSSAMGELLALVDRDQRN